ncbi:hypothetical protein QKW35_13585 [Pontibacterium granulatum]|uniref:hypothetical protein n=1 Tax=Pontibacterium granulatum TaxID=2036029 RepID=UPI00249B656C|nr:hypothetical protein [Pontibacterium granulatum]MDI3325408.1 hypothetical protein [Pontibacterium granulatum]
MKFLRVPFLLSIMLLASVYVHAGSVVVNTGVNEISISRQFLLSAFAMRTKRWSDGTPIQVFVLPDENPHHVRFVKSSLHIFPYQLRNIWDRAVFSGSGQSPHVVQSEEEMLERIRTVKGAVGYTSKELEGEHGVKQLKVY